MVTFKSSKASRDLQRDSYQYLQVHAMLHQQLHHFTGVVHNGADILKAAICQLHTSPLQYLHIHPHIHTTNSFEHSLGSPHQVDFGYYYEL